jgi:hypothetical protein
MREVKYVAILANSVREKKRCVAGKEVFPRADGKYEIGPWIRFADPNDPHGAVSRASTLCGFIGGVRAARPLDIVEAVFTGSCVNADHPEDCFFDTRRRWQIVDKLGYEKLRELQDCPVTLWNDGVKPNSVPAGYVRNMGRKAATLYLLKAPTGWSFAFWRSEAPDDASPGQMKERQHRVLSFRFGGMCHEFSVTDDEFNDRHKIFDRASGLRQLLTIPDSTNVFFCLSLTPEFRNRHYKIGATIFEPK